MSIASDARFWDRAARKYAANPVADREAYTRSLDATRALLKRTDHVIELGCGTGTTAMKLASSVAAYLATDISAEMISIARERNADAPVPGLEFRAAMAEQIVPGEPRADAVLGFNYLHMVRDLPGTLRGIHGMLADNGLLITKTPCLGDMNPLLRWVALPLMQAFGKAPHAGSFTGAQLCDSIRAAGFEILSVENHGSGGNDHRPFIVARRA